MPYINNQFIIFLLIFSLLFGYSVRKVWQFQLARFAMKNTLMRLDFGFLKHWVCHLLSQFLTEFSDCAHSICLDCANKLVKDIELICPFCRETTIFGTQGIQCLKTNFALLEVVEDARNQRFLLKLTICSNFSELSELLKSKIWT